MVRILILSDIHANLTALETVLDDAGKYDAVWCLGDLVGYGPDPSECISRVRALPNLLCLMGNHDAAAVGELDISTFNPEAKSSILWTKDQLSPEDITFLRSLSIKEVVDSTTLVHGSPRSPIFEYLLDTHSAAINFDYFTTEFCFVGHTHLPLQYLRLSENSRTELRFPPPPEPFAIETRSILNPGSVGQPRDRDPRASYAFYYPKEQVWEYRRVPYDIPAVQERMEAFNLPLKHILRLANGW